MSGTCWRWRARDLVASGVLPDDPKERAALVATADAEVPFEPYFKVKSLIMRLEARSNERPG